VEVKHYELSQIYSNYIKRLAIFMSKCKILELTPQKVKDYLKKTAVNDVLWIYGEIHNLIDMIVNKVALMKV
jgi:hypothetical protein